MQSLHTFFLNYGLKLALAEAPQRPAFAAWLASGRRGPDGNAGGEVCVLGRRRMVAPRRSGELLGRPGNFPYPLLAERCTYRMFGDNKAQLAGKRTAGSAGLKKLRKTLALPSERHITVGKCASAQQQFSINREAPRKQILINYQFS